MKPRVFVSSTILDFEDLRSSLKFYLEEFGYEVQMSEFPNFDVDRDSSAFDACLKNLEKCQYFILLMGYRRGAWYEEKKLSITHKEYLTAKSLIEKGYPLRLISFVRKPIWLLRSDRQALAKHFEQKTIELTKEINRVGSDVIDDPDYIFKFLDEVKEGVKIPDSDSPVNNWIFDFEGFSDIVTALKHTFKITESVYEKRLKRLLIEVLKQNFERFYIVTANLDPKNKVDVSQKAKENFLDFFRKRYFPKLFDKNGQSLLGSTNLTIPGEDLIYIFMNTMIYPSWTNLRKLRTPILNKILSEGILLTYDVTSNDYKTNYLTYAMDKLSDMVEGFINSLNSDIEKNFSKEMSRLMTDGSTYKPKVDLSLHASGMILFYGMAARIPELISCILKYLENNDDSDLVKFDFSQNYYFKKQDSENEINN